MDELMNKNLLAVPSSEDDIGVRAVKLNTSDQRCNNKVVAGNES